MDQAWGAVRDTAGTESSIIELQSISNQTTGVCDMDKTVGRMLNTVQSAGTLDRINKRELVWVEEATNLPEDS